MQDALFVGSPASATGLADGLAALQAASPQRRQSLFAALSPRGAAADRPEDADSSHLLSSSLSCLDDGGAGESLLARHLSASHSGSRSGSGSMGAAADQLLSALRQQQAGWPSGSDAAAGQAGDVAALLGAAADADAAGSPTRRMGPLSPGGSSQRGLGDAAGDPSGDESDEPTRHLWIGNLGTRTPRQVLKTIFER